jgi:DNA-binding NarL/FixJ family response regulator
LTAIISPPISCLLVDDHPALVEAVSRVLDGAGMRIVGTASSAAKGLELLERRPADVAVVDLRLPDMNGIELAQAIAKSSSPARTLLYSGYADSRLAVQALSAGVHGLIAKGSPMSEVVRAVRTVAAGGTYVDPLLGAQLVEASSRSSLSERDELLLKHMSRGLTDERIAVELHLSPETVRANVRRLVQTLDAKNRTHAVALALRAGLIQ